MTSAELNLGLSKSPTCTHTRQVESEKRGDGSRFEENEKRGFNSRLENEDMHARQVEFKKRGAAF